MALTAAALVIRSILSALLVTVNPLWKKHFMFKQPQLKIQNIQLLSSQDSTQLRHAFIQIEVYEY